MSLIRRLQDSDLPDYSKFHLALANVAKAPGFSWSEAAWLTEFKAAEVWGLWGQGGLEALLAWRLAGDAREVSFLVSHPSVRRQGRMRALWESVHGASSHNEWWLEVHEANEPARRLYQSWGFIETGRRPRYYPDGGAAVLMSKPPESGCNPR